uniref:Uncharacterized protein n=1 Tax=Anguilla anguilla TaxID=7936 RepID=A0A0E9R0C4_ANGAN
MVVVQGLRAPAFWRSVSAPAREGALILLHSICSLQLSLSFRGPSPVWPSAKFLLLLL